MRWIDFGLQISAARCPKFLATPRPFLGSGSPLHPPGVSRPGGSPAAGSSGHAMVWSWYGWPLEFKGRAPHGKVTAGLERVTAGHGGARRGGVTAVTVLGGASPPGGGHVRILFAASAARASDRWICGYQCRRLNGLLPFRCPPPPTWDLGACAEERARYLLGGPPRIRLTTGGGSG
jgi:hypothetical protein